MAKVRAWTGSAWKDVSFWSGTQWKPGYTPAVYNNVVADYQFASNREGFVNDSAAEPPSVGSAWTGGYIYCTVGSTSYTYYSGMLRTLNVTRLLEPGSSFRVQAAMAIPRTKETSGVTTSINLQTVCRFTEGFSKGIYGTKTGISGSGTSTWQTVTSDPYTLPAGKDPISVLIEEIRVEARPNTNAALGPFDEFQLRCAWVKLIDQDGNTLKSLTAAAVEHMKVWSSVDGAWV